MDHDLAQHQHLKDRAIVSFTSLPNEIRHQIYRELYQRDEPICFDTPETYMVAVPEPESRESILLYMKYYWYPFHPSRKRWSAATSFLRSCRLVADEATNVFYANTFYFKGGADFVYKQDCMGRPSYLHAGVHIDDLDAPATSHTTSDKLGHLRFFQVIGPQNRGKLRHVGLFPIYMVDSCNRAAPWFSAYTTVFELLADASNLRSLTIGCAKWHIWKGRFSQTDSRFVRAMGKLGSLPLLKINVTRNPECFGKNDHLFPGILSSNGTFDPCARFQPAAFSLTPQEGWSTLKEITTERLKAYIEDACSGNISSDSSGQHRPMV